MIDKILNNYETIEEEANADRIRMEKVEQWINDLENDFLEESCENLSDEFSQFSKDDER